VNGFTGAVSLSLTGLPASVGTATINPTPITTAGSSQLTVSTAASATPGSYPLTITGSSGSLQHSKTVTLTVAAAGDFALSASRSSASIYRGQTASYPVSASSISGFAGSVSLSVSGLPAYATATWVGNPITAPGSATLRVRAASWTPRGTFTLRITGTSGGLSHLATVTLVVR